MHNAPQQNTLPQAGGEAPTISLGGRNWVIPKLSARQNRVIDPLILKLLPVFSGWQQEGQAAIAGVNSEHYEALQEIAYQAISRAAPDITRELFLDLPVTLPELVAAFPVVAEQTGIFARGAPGEA